MRNIAEVSLPHPHSTAFMQGGWFQLFPKHSCIRTGYLEKALKQCRSLYRCKLIFQKFFPVKCHARCLAIVSSIKIHIPIPFTPLVWRKKIKYW